MPDNKVEELFNMFIGEDLIDDRREYDINDLMTAYPDITMEQSIELQKILQER